MRKLLLFICIVYCAACSEIDALRDIDDLKTDAEFAIPIISSEINIKQIVEDIDDGSSLLIDPDGLLRFFYEGDLVIRDSKEVFDQIRASLPPAIPVFDTLLGFPVSSSTITLDKLIFKGSILDLTFFNPNSQSVTVDLQIPQLIENGQPLQRTLTAGAFSTVGLSSIDLDQVVLIPQNDSLYIRYQAKLPNDSIAPIQSFFILPKDLDFSYAEGILGSEVFESQPDTLAVDFYDNWTQGDVRFEDPKVTVYIENSFGFPALAIAEVLDVITDKEGQVSIESPFVTDGFPFNYPGFDEIGAIKTTTFVFDKSNSNIVDVVSAGPEAFIYDLDVINNPAIQEPGFVTDSSFFAYRLDAEFPFEGSLADFVNRDTTDLDLSDYEDIEALELKLVANNQIPLGVSIQGIFLDAKQNPIDSLFETTALLVSPAPTNALGIAETTFTQTSFIELDAAKLDRVKKASYLALISTFATSGNGRQTVKVFDDQILEIKIGAKVKVQ